MHAIIAPCAREDVKRSIKSCLPTIIGTVVEYYDYTLYGFFAVLIAQQFFPEGDPVVNLLKTFGIFLVGSVSKPLGSVIFSQIGDREGRIAALKLSMLGIALPTTVIGLMPGFAEIGWWAPCLLLLCRITQGMFVSGESDGVRIFLFETLGPRFAYTASGLSGIACMLGIYAASFAASIIAAHNFPAWAWRVPFLISGVLGMLVFWLRTSLRETPDFIRCRETASSGNTRSFVNVLWQNKKILISTILICGSAGGSYHFYLVFFGTYLSSVLGILNSSLSALYTSQSILIFSIGVLSMGIFADYFGEIIILKVCMGCLIVMIGLNIHDVYQGEIRQWVMLLTAFFMTPIHSIGLVLVYKKLLAGERFRCSSIGHAVGSMLFSGTAPWISLWLWRITDYNMAPLWYFLALAIMGYVATIPLVVCKADPLFQSHSEGARLTP